MLGSATDAEDVVQDASIRWLRRSDRAVESVRAYLVTIVTRLCLDQLELVPGEARHVCGAVVARAGGGRGPLGGRAGGFAVPGLSGAPGGAHTARTRRLSAARRLRLSLRGGGPLVGSVSGCLPATRRRGPAKHIEERRQRFDADLRQGRELTDRFLVACATGDLWGLLSMLADDVVVWTDGGGKVRAALRPVVGPLPQFRFLINVAKKQHGVPLPPVLNGQPATSLWTGDSRGRAGAGHHGRVRSSASGRSRTRTSSHGSTPSSSVGRPAGPTRNGTSRALVDGPCRLPCEEDRPR